MRRTLTAVATAVFFLACTATAQEIPLTPEMKKWEPILGKWKSENEVRKSPTGAWEKGSWVYEYRSGGFFLDIRGVTEVGGQRTSWIEIVGYDPIQRGYVSSFFDSDGLRGGVTSMGWNGTTVTVNFIRITSERETEIGRGTWEYSADFKTVTLTSEMFTDGQWWNCFKLEDTKVE
jgi:hypothetical protein